MDFGNEVRRYVLAEGQAWTLIEAATARIVIESRRHPQLGVRVRREITLGNDPSVRILNTLTRETPSPFPVHSWSITQVKHPLSVELDLADDAPASVPVWRPYGGAAATLEANAQATADTLRWTLCNEAGLTYEDGHKVGAYGRRLTAFWEDCAWTQTTPYDPAIAYPAGSNLQVYTEPKYTELETISDLRHLQVGESLEHEVVWELRPAP